MHSLRSALLWTVRILAAGIVFLTPLIIAPSLFFPFITGKNFFFRITVEIMTAAWVALAIIDPAFRPRRSPILIAVGLFITAIGISTIVGVYPYHSFWSNFERMEGYVTYLHLAALFVVFAHIFRTKREWLYLLSTSIVASIFVTLYGVCEHITPQSATESFCFTGSGGSRPYATFGNPIYLAVYLLFHLFLLGGTFVRSRIEMRALIIPIMALEAYVFLLASSRGAFIGACAGLMTLASFLIIFNKSLRYRFAAFAAILVVVFTLLFVQAFPENRIVKNTEVLSRLSRVSIQNLSSEPRIRIWGMGIEAFRERPLFGWGPENFIIPYAQYYNPDLFGNEPWFDRVHNMFIEWLVAGGFVGLSLYLGMFAVVCIALVRAFRGHRLGQVECGVALGLVASYLVQDAFVFDNITTYLFLFSGLAFVHHLAIGGEVQVKHFLARPRPHIIVSLVGVSLALVVVVYVVNIRALVVARQIIVGLTSVSEAKSAQDLIDNFDRAIQMDTFGTTEARERISDLTVQATLRAPQISEDFLKLIDYNIIQLEAESARQPDVIKYDLFLGKLYLVKANATGTGFEKSEEHYLDALERAPNYIQTRLGLAELYLHTGEYEKARQTAYDIIRLPTDRDSISRLIPPTVSIYLLIGRYDDAINVLKDYHADPGVISIQEALGISDIRAFVARALAYEKDLQGRKVFLETLLIFFDPPKSGVNPQIISTVLVGLAQTESELGNIVRARELAVRAEKIDSSLHEQVEKFLKSLGADQ